MVSIKKRKIKYKCHVVYFLFNGENLIYVGMSKNWKTRMDKHKTEGLKIFDSFSFIECINFDLAEKCEKFYIKKYCPKYNIKDNPNYIPIETPIEKEVNREDRLQYWKDETRKKILLSLYNKYTPKFFGIDVSKEKAQNLSRGTVMWLIDIFKQNEKLMKKYPFVLERGGI